MKKKIILSTGGTGGHIYPMVALHDYLVSKNFEVIFVSDQRAMKYFNLDVKEKVKIFNINSPFNKKGFYKLMAYCQLLVSTIKSIFFLINNKPSIIIGSGGYASFPILMAGYLLKINILIYETNSILGRTNKFFYFLSKKLLLGYDNQKYLPKKYQKKSIYVGQLLRKSFTEKRNEANIFNPNKNEFTILMLGGSQGAEFFGSRFATLFSELKNSGFKIKIFHQCKENQVESIRQAYQNFTNYELFEFNPNIEKIMKQSDLAIVRSGSSTISELIAVSLPFIAIPLPSSMDNHQYYNAKYFEDRGCCWLIDQNQFDAEKFKKLIADILGNDKEKLREKIKNIKLLNQDQALNNFEKIIIEYL